MTVFVEIRITVVRLGRESAWVGGCGFASFSYLLPAHTGSFSLFAPR